MRHNVLFATAFATLVSTSAFAADLPGKGITVQPVQSTISEESFQTLIVSRALEKLGYTVNTPSEVDYNVGYTSIASGDATFTAVNWQPLHDDMYAAAGGDKKSYRDPDLSGSKRINGSWKTHQKPSAHIRSFGTHGSYPSTKFSAT